MDARKEGARGKGAARRGERGGLAFNYLGFPREEAIHLRVYAIFGGEIAPGARECRRVFRNITTIYTRVLFHAVGRPAAGAERRREEGREKRAGGLVYIGARDESRVISRGIARFSSRLPQRIPPGRTRVSTMIAKRLAVTDSRVRGGEKKEEEMVRSIWNHAPFSVILSDLIVARRFARVGCAGSLNRDSVKLYHDDSLIPIRATEISA